MRIVLVAPASSIHTVRWANGLAARGHDVHIVSIHAASSQIDRAAVTVHKIGPRAPLGYVAAARRLRRIVRSLEPDIVNVHFASGYGTLVRRAGLGDLLPTLLSVWGSDVYDFPKKSVAHRRLIRRNLQAATVIASTSYAMAREMSRTCFRPHVHITPFGIDEALFSPDSEVPAERLAERGATVVVGTVKALYRKYGVDTLIEAFVLARNALPVTLPIRLVIAGDGPDRAALEALARERGVGDYVTFTGGVPHGDVPALLRTFDIYAALSRLDSESFGVAIVEASSCGLPVIVSDADGPREVTIDGQTGFVVARDDPAAAAGCIVELAGDARLRWRMGAAGRRHVLDHYTWAGSLDRMEAAYADAIARFHGPQCIVVHPHAISPDARSASGIRPRKMVEAFARAGYRVDLIDGASNDRAVTIRALRRAVRSGATFGFAYFESSTMPTALADPHHLPVRPRQERRLLRFLARHHIPTGLFYRDVYWAYPEYRERVGGVKAALALHFYRTELRAYERLVTRLYLPSDEMAPVLPFVQNAPISALPPGHDVDPDAAGKGSGTGRGRLRAIYVGGVSNHYRLDAVVDAAAGLPGVEFVIVSRPGEWEAAQPSYATSIPETVTRVAAMGSDLNARLDEADVALLFVDPLAYWRIVMPVKLFEYLGHHLPIVASAGTLAGRFVEENGIGWTVPYDADALVALFTRLAANPFEIDTVRARCAVVARAHTWDARATQVIDDLAGR